jgi:pyruvate carboxylase
MQRALAEMLITGVSTTIPFLQRVLKDPAFRAGEVSTQLVPELMARSNSLEDAETRAGLAPPLGEAVD